MHHHPTPLTIPLPGGGVTSGLLEVPEGTVKSRLRLARQQMRRQLINVEEW